MVSSMLKVFLVDVYALLDLGATLYFVMPFVARMFDVSPKEFLEHISVSTPIGDFVVARRVYRRYHIFMSHRVTLVDMVEVDIQDLM